MGKKMAILVLASGVSHAPELPDPLLALVDGQDILTRLIRCAGQTGIPVFVTIATDATERAKAISGETVTLIPIPNSRTDMSAVLRAGIRSLPDGLDGVLILMADMPAITSDDLAVLLTHFAELGAKRVIGATDETGQPGHPVILPARLFRIAARLRGGQNARSLMLSEEYSLVRLPEGHAYIDIEKPTDWVAWRAPGVQANH